jgi:RNA polymerase sigma-70 factor (ECF subfamily)
MTGDPTADDRAREEAREEERLVVEAQRGSIDAFNRLVRRYERQVYNVALRIVGQADLAEDVTQDTFLLAYRSLHQFRGGIFRAWILRIATNRCYDELRRRRHRPTSFEALGFEPAVGWSSLSPGAGGEEPEAHAERRELGRALAAALRGLPDEQRVAVVLSDVEGYAYHEIAAILGVPLGTVRSRISRGRARLRTALRGALPDVEPSAVVPAHPHLPNPDSVVAA